MTSIYKLKRANLVIKPLPIIEKKQPTQILPDPLRCLIVGTSGCGKTTLLYNIMTEESGLSYKHLIVYSKTLEQPFYIEMRKSFKKLADKYGEDYASFYEDCEELINVDDCPSDTLVVFDDCVNSKGQNIIKDYFSRGRHKNISCIYLTQSLTKIDRQLIRNNLNCLFVFRQQKHYAKQIYDQYVGSDFDFDDFMKICNICWSTPFGFLTIYTTVCKKKRKYRKNLSEIFF